jgi:citrate/tricarballylate utilization protein
MMESEVINSGVHMMTVCNACRYCEGFCAVWRAMEYRRNFSESDLNYLANLCHDCSECYYACQYAPPHEWAINPPLTFARLRGRFYEQHSWPGVLASAFRANGIVFSLISALAIILFLFGVVYFRESKILLTAVSEGNFYQIIPHNVMVATFGIVGLFSATALIIGFSRFCRSIGEKVSDLFNPSTLPATLREVLRLEHLDGGGWGCAYPGEVSSSLTTMVSSFHFLRFPSLLAATTTVLFIIMYSMACPAWMDKPTGILGILGGSRFINRPAG